MSLQHRATAEPVSENTLRFYFPAEIVTDSGFPFTAGDTVVARTIRHEAVVLTPPSCALTSIDLPPVRSEVLHERD